MKQEQQIPSSILPVTILLLEDKISPNNELLYKLLNQGFACQVVDTIDAARYCVESGIINLLIITQNAFPGNEILSLRDLADDYLPVLVISDELTDEILDRYAEANIEALVPRPVNFRYLLLNIRASLRLRQFYSRETKMREQLLKYWQKVDLEQEFAAKIFNNILRIHNLETEVVKAVISPMSLFNGDLLLVSRTPKNHLHVLLGDFTGHGLSASIAATPTAEIFSGMTRKGFATIEIVAEINRKLHKMLPVNIFLAASVVALMPESKTMSIITCGLPEHFLVNHDVQTCKIIQSLNIPLGIQADFEIEEQVFNVSGGECLYLLTDGIFEAENSRGESFGKQRIIDAICKSPVEDIEILQTSLTQHCTGLNQKDDFAIVKLICDVENVPWRDTGSEQPKRQVKALTWKTMMEFDINTLRVLNPVPMMVNVLMEIQGLQDHRQAIFMIASELFANALDHGLLKLDSGIKSNPEGFMQFYLLKDQRLESCREGHICFNFAHTPTEQGGRLIINVQDSGEGFDWRNFSQNTFDNNVNYSGRGVKLVESICSSLEFKGKGNLVTAVYDWKK